MSRWPIIAIIATLSVPLVPPKPRKSEFGSSQVPKGTVIRTTIYPRPVSRAPEVRIWFKTACIPNPEELKTACIPNPERFKTACIPNPAGFKDGSRGLSGAIPPVRRARCYLDPGRGPRSIQHTSVIPPGWGNKVWGRVPVVALNSARPPATFCEPYRVQSLGS
jgi:hypothetical protein